MIEGLKAFCCLEMISYSNHWMLHVSFCCLSCETKKAFTRNKIGGNCLSEQPRISLKGKKNDYVTKSLLSVSLVLRETRCCLRWITFPVVLEFPCILPIFPHKALGRVFPFHNNGSLPRNISQCWCFARVNLRLTHYTAFIIRFLWHRQKTFSFLFTCFWLIWKFRWIYSSWYQAAIEIYCIICKMLLLLIKDACW